MANHADSSPSAEDSSSLQSAIHAATRSLHTRLNVGIMHRLPQCIPPKVSDPTAYYLGILTFGQIFVAFERAIEDVSSEHLPPSQVETERVRQRRIIETLHTTGLTRTLSLKHDTDVLRERLLLQKEKRDSDVLLRIDERVRDEADTRMKHITQRIQKSPHLALAYTWTMYLALFNGGRHIRRALARAGPAFWLENKQPGPMREQIDTLTFWDFEAATEEDPEADQLKLDFKRKFDEASHSLTEGEREEVVQEAKRLFELCMELVEILDDIMADYAQQSTVAAASLGTSQSCAESKTWTNMVHGFVAPLNRVLNLNWTRPLVEETKE